MAKKTLTNKNSIKFLENYLNNASPTGFESEGQKLWLDYIRPYVDDYFVDTYGTVVGVINPEAKYKVVIEAHADEISWFVHYITKEGFIYLRRNGGSDHQIAPSKRVNIHTKNGTVDAILDGQQFTPVMVLMKNHLNLIISFLTADVVVKKKLRNLVFTLVA